jgi:predicted Rossmann fold flavoprotein
VSGGSRCNLTNAAVTERDFWGGRPPVVRRVLRAFPVGQTVAFFRELGVPVHEEAGGKLFPDTNRARDVLDALLREAARLGVALRTGERVTAIARSEAGLEITSTGGRVQARAVVLATGGQSLPKTGSDGAGFAFARSLGHTIVAPTPALVPLVLAEDDPLHRALAGVAQDVELTIWTDGTVGTRLAGALLWTHAGASGPAAMNASRHWLRARAEGRQAAITVNFMHGAAFEHVDRQWAALARERPGLSLQHALATMMPASAAAALLAHQRLDGATPLAHLARGDRRALVHGLVAWPLPVTGTRGYNYAEATAGGVDLAEIDPSTMASRVCPGLYLVGEILDVDGRIGGFNFQWAWSSARVAGAALARMEPAG